MELNAAEFSLSLAAVKNRTALPAADWKSLSSRYPYAPAFKVLQLLALREEESAEWAELLHQTAARTLSRSRLQYLVEGEPELEAEWLSLPARPVAETEVLPAEVPAEESGPEAEEAKSPEDAVAAEDHASVPEQVTAPEVTPGTEKNETVTGEANLPEVAAAPVDEKAETAIKANEFVFSFVRLKAGRKPKESPVPEEKPAPAAEDKKTRTKRNQQEAIIEKFLNEKPFLQPRLDFGEEGKVPDLASRSGKLKEEIVTESMAMIYIRQKKIPQAIATLRKLTLKIPEKSAYFATLINNLESQNPS